MFQTTNQPLNSVYHIFRRPHQIWAKCNPLSTGSGQIAPALSPYLNLKFSRNLHIVLPNPYEDWTGSTWDSKSLRRLDWQHVGDQKPPSLLDVGLLIYPPLSNLDLQMGAVFLHSKHPVPKNGGWTHGKMRNTNLQQIEVNLTSLCLCQQFQPTKIPNTNVSPQAVSPKKSKKHLRLSTSSVLWLTKCPKTNSFLAVEICGKGYQLMCLKIGDWSPIHGNFPILQIGKHVENPWDFEV